ncbi:MAG: NHL repeat-containing protein [Chloroflexota bacterium]
METLAAIPLARYVFIYKCYFAAEGKLMRRFVTILLALVVLTVLTARGINAQSAQSIAQTSEQTYRNETLGLTFQYPADWVVTEQMATRTVMAASKSDMEAIKLGKTPSGLLFTVTLSSFRLIGAARLEDFTPILRNIAQAPDLVPQTVHIGGVTGLAIEVADPAQQVAARTAILSLGKRQVAVLRGVATTHAWTTGAAAQLDKIVGSLSFDPPESREDLDAFGQVIWQVADDKLQPATGLAVSADGSSLFVAERDAGILWVGSGGTVNELTKPSGPGQFWTIGLLGEGMQYVADPTSHTIWRIAPTASSAERFIGGQVGDKNGSFGKESPQAFTFGPKGAIYVLDENVKGLRIQVFNRAGEWTANWDLTPLQSAPIDHPLISSDDDGNIYVVGRNSAGVIKFDPQGKVIARGLGKDELSNVTPLALLADRAENMYIATADEAILKLDAKGKLVGIVGEPYDEAAPPKPGQLGNPTAMALGQGGKLLYVADSGKYPHIVAFGLTANHTLSVLSGTKDAGPINYGQTVTGEITASTFVDTYALIAKTNDVLTITMKPGEGSKLDPYVDLVAPNKNRLAANDDAVGEGLGPTDAQIRSYRIPFDGTYIIRATRFGRETTTGTGSYSLTITLEKSGTRGTYIPPTITRTPSITPLPPTATATNTVTSTPLPPTLTPSQTPTDTPLPPTIRPSRTPLPTFTLTPSKTPRVTQSPNPTLTPTRIPPTPTQIPPTKVPPTLAPSVTPTTEVAL